MTEIWIPSKGSFLFSGIFAFFTTNTIKNFLEWRGQWYLWSSCGSVSLLWTCQTGQFWGWEDLTPMWILACNVHLLLQKMFYTTVSCIPAWLFWFRQPSSCFAISTFSSELQVNSLWLKSSNVLTKNCPKSNQFRTVSGPWKIPN